MSFTIAELHQLQPLRGIPDSALAALLPLGRQVEFAPGEVLIAPDQVVARALLLVRGRLAVTVEEGGQSRPVGEVWPGEIVGESALFEHPGRSQVKVTAMAPSAALEVTPELLQAARGTAALVALQVHLVHALSRRIRATNHGIRRAWQERRAEQARKTAPVAPDPSPGFFERLFRAIGGEHT